MQARKQRSNQTTKFFPSLLRRGPIQRNDSSGTRLYSVSQSVVITKDGSTVQYDAPNISVEAVPLPSEPVMGPLNGLEEDGRPPQVSLIASAERFPSDVLLLILSHHLWSAATDPSYPDPSRPFLNPSYQPTRLILVNPRKNEELSKSLFPFIPLGRSGGFTRQWYADVLSDAKSKFGAVPPIPIVILLLRFTAVCAHWRQTCASTPLLGSRLLIELPHLSPRTNAGTPLARRHLSLCQHFLTKSKHSPQPPLLSLVIRADTGQRSGWSVDTRLALAKLAAAVAQNEVRERWRELEITELDDRFILSLVFGFEFRDEEGPYPHAYLEVTSALPSGSLDSNLPVSTPKADLSPHTAVRLSPAPRLEKLVLHMYRVVPHFVAVPDINPGYLGTQSNTSKREWFTIRQETVLDFIRGMSTAYLALESFELTIEEADDNFSEDLMSAVAGLFRPEGCDEGLQPESEVQDSEGAGKGGEQVGQGERPNVYEKYRLWHEECISEVRKKREATATTSTWYTRAKRRMWVKIGKGEEDSLPVIEWSILPCTVLRGAVCSFPHTVLM
ncbi:hypothetical protein D9611_001840 [Ephemerocybe angulata]|uniref:Uncharacterized protein n=1 Tax=Ephemerocybe angulata TaxID=980116 RepID=A0A8H5CIA0_9AGAR|nr:hypothetical protein D9611_001840 [Tulosesus angulatus]